jgi:hypothetical protein
MFRKHFLNKTKMKISFETLPPLAQDKKALYRCWALLMNLCVYSGNSKTKIRFMYGIKIYKESYIDLEMELRLIKNLPKIDQ